MAGKVVEYCALNGIPKGEITSDTLKNLFTITQNKEVFCSREDLENIEEQAIIDHLETNPTSLLLNMKKNPNMKPKARSLTKTNKSRSSAQEGEQPDIPLP